MGEGQAAARQISTVAKRLCCLHRSNAARKFGLWGLVILFVTLAGHSWWPGGGRACPRLTAQRRPRLCANVQGLPRPASRRVRLQANLAGADLGTTTDFIVKVEGGTTTFEASSRSAEEWLLKNNRAKASDPRPLRFSRDKSGATIFLEALTRKGFVCQYANGDVAEHHVQSEENGSSPMFGCGLIAALLLLVPPIYALNKCSSAPPNPPTREETASDREAQRAEAQRANFDRGQAALWKQPASSLKESNLRAELNKCYSAINPPNAPEAYLSYPDEKDALESAKTYGSVRLTGQRSSPLGGVSVQEYTCHFKGAGFEYLSTDDAGRMKGFVSE